MKEDDTEAIYSVFNARPQFYINWSLKKFEERIEETESLQIVAWVKCLWIAKCNWLAIFRFSIHY